VVPEIDLKIVVLGNRHDTEVNFNPYYSQILNDKITELVTSNKLMAAGLQPRRSIMILLRNSLKVGILRFSDCSPLNWLRTLKV
jgi:hypothetical protein